VLDLEKLSLNQAREVIQRSILKISPYLHAQYLRTLQEIGGLEMWSLADLKDVNDANEVYYLPKDCTMAQAAVRQNRTVYLDSSLYGSLTSGQLAVLEAHEVFYLMGEIEKQLVTSEKVREVLKHVLGLDLKRDFASRASASIGGHIYPSQALSFTASTGISGRVTYSSVSDSRCTLEVIDSRGTRPADVLMIRTLRKGCFDPKDGFPGSYLNPDFKCGIDLKTCNADAYKGSSDPEQYFLENVEANGSSFTLRVNAKRFDDKPITFKLD
jgi:hypothetical protein